MTPRELKGKCVSCPIQETCVCKPLDDFGVQRPFVDDLNCHFQAGQTIYSKEDSITHFFQVVEGMVRLVHYSKEGTKTIFGFLCQGDWYGLFTQESHLYSLEAVCPTELCFYQKDGFQKLVLSIPALEQNLKVAEESRYKWTMHQIRSHSLKKPADKLMIFLAMLCFRWQGEGKRGKNLMIPLSRADIASYLGLTQESVSRAFAFLKKEGIIEMPSSKHVSILDFDAFYAEVLDV